MPSCRSDPCGIVCIIITYSAVFYADYVVVWHLVIPVLSNTLWGMVCVLMFNVIVFLMTVSHLRAVLSDPGIVPLPKTGLDFSDLHAGRTIPNTKDGWSVCNKCETYRPPRAHHCRICRRCIRKMDHHCPWINNCVGEFNQKYFIQFLFYVGMLSCFATTMVVLSWFLDPHANTAYKHTKLIHSVILVVESILFGMFVIAIGCDQISSILSDETLVEQVKKEGLKRGKLSTYDLFQEVFGKGHPAGWLCPLFSEVSTEKTSKQYIV